MCTRLHRISDYEQLDIQEPSYITFCQLNSRILNGHHTTPLYTRSEIVNVCTCLADPTLLTYLPVWEPCGTLCVGCLASQTCYSLTWPTVMQSAASSYGVEGILLQDYDGIMHLITHAPQRLTSAQTNYVSIEKELLAVIWLWEVWEIFLVLDSCRVCTDHIPLIRNNIIVSDALSRNPISKDQSTSESDISEYVYIG